MKSRILFACVATAAIALTYTQSASASHRSKEEHAFSQVKSPEIPKSMVFAGQKVDLTPVNMYERFDRELTSMAYTHGNTLLTIKRANRLFPVMAPILESENVPADLLYLACIESTLDPFAVSSAKAAGLWQFMPATGREYGLEVNDYVDERFDVENPPARLAST